MQIIMDQVPTLLLQLLAQPQVIYQVERIIHLLTVKVLEKAALEMVVPEKVVLEKAAPEKVVPEKVVPEKAVPEKVVPEKAVPEKVESLHHRCKF